MDLSWLKKLAPTVATALGGPLAGLAVEAVGSALGMKDATKESITELLEAGQLKPEQIAALKKAEIDIKVKMKELDIQETDLHAKDRQSARTMLTNTKSLVPAILTVVTVGGFFTLLIGAAANRFTLSGSDVMMLLLGVLARETASVYQFWFGSSKGSQDKTDLLKR